MSPSLALQAMIDARLCADAAVLALVPADDIDDRRGRPASYPSILFGEAREYPLGAVKRDSTRLSLDLHVWTDTPGTREAKEIVSAVRRALRDAPWEADGHAVLDVRFEGARYLPDPSNADITHGVVTVYAFMLETA